MKFFMKSESIKKNCNRFPFALRFLLFCVNISSPAFFLSEFISSINEVSFKTLF